MKKTKKSFLPIGSVVLLKDATKKVMVTGYCSVENNNSKKIYDYNGCIYPEGYLNSEQTCLFNHDQIDTIYYFGWEDEEQKKFQKKLVQFLDSISTKE